MAINRMEEFENLIMI
ncbi:Protein of unknown function [Lactobacillus delbrueckii subsp. bulgaricus]|nr:Protein of unknown function [Lactobacillus delbrueckii subsp. bulgaricus]